MQLYRYFVSQCSEFCRHNPLCCSSTSVYSCKCIFRYQLSPETFGYTLVQEAWWRSHTNSRRWHWMEMSGQLHAPVFLLGERSSRRPLDVIVGRPHIRSGGLEVVPGIEFRLSSPQIHPTNWVPLSILRSTKC